MTQPTSPLQLETTILNVGGMQVAFKETQVADHLSRHPGVTNMEVSPVDQVATVSFAPPITAGIFEPSLGLQLRPDCAAIAMSGLSFLVAANALLLKRRDLPTRPQASTVEVTEADTGHVTARQKA